MVALPGVDPLWSTHQDVPSTATVDPNGTVNRWHYLDNSASLTAQPHGTLLCVHGNPTWSYLWRSLLRAGTGAGWRVIAVDQLDMGYSERTGRFRPLADRVSDLEDFTAAVGLAGPVVTVGHDWGGVVSLGYAHRNRENLAGVVLTNTAIHQDPDEQIPAALRLALHGAVHKAGTSGTTAFLDTTLALARPRLDPQVRAAYRDPYRRRSRRQGIANFVADIPADSSHPSYETLQEIADGIRTLSVPALMLWGPADPIFSDSYLEDLTRRLPHADVHRFEGAGHLVAEDRDIATPVFSWLAQHVHRSADNRVPRQHSDVYLPLWHQLGMRAGDVDSGLLAVADMGKDGAMAESLTWAELQHRVEGLAVSLASIGVRSGSRVSLMVPPGIALTVLIYACLRLGAVIVVADAGLGAKGLSRAVKGAVPDFLVGIGKALAAARVFGWPGIRISLTELPAPHKRLLGVSYSLEQLTSLERGPITAPEPLADDDAAILFTSGSTGPAKGVVYTHRQLAAMRDTLASTFGIRPGGALVAGFAPFALLGPALGTASVTPNMDVTAPRTLTAQALADAAAAISATVVFASPAALRNVLSTSKDLTPGGRAALGGVGVVLSAGAPVPEPLLGRVQDLMPKASLHTPYGMTEALPVTDIDLETIREASAGASTVQGAGNGVCVGHPVHGVEVMISALDDAGAAEGEPTSDPGITGEILVRAAHVKDRYHRLWLTERDSSRTSGWHRTGDVGHFDAAGRLWVEGRLGHIVTSPAGIVTPVGLEQAIEALEQVALAAIVGVGPSGTQAVVAVVEPVPGVRKPGLADAQLSQAVRAASHAAGTSLAAVLVVPSLPTDIRHNAKIDRSRVAAWAAGVLGGGRTGAL